MLPVHFTTFHCSVGAERSRSCSQKFFTGAKYCKILDMEAFLVPSCQFGEFNCPPFSPSSSHNAAFAEEAEGLCVSWCLYVHVHWLMYFASSENTCPPLNALTHQVPSFDRFQLRSWHVCFRLLRGRPRRLPEKATQ